VYYFYSSYLIVLGVEIALSMLMVLHHLSYRPDLINISKKVGAKRITYPVVGIVFYLLFSF